MVNAKDGARFWVRVNTSDRLMIWEIWNAKAYDDKHLPIGEEDTVVDIGAHIGAFSVRAARLAHHGHVFSYEPSSKNFSMLMKNRLLNEANNLYVEESAVSGRNGRMTLFTPAGNPIMGSLLQGTSAHSETVNVTTIPDIIATQRIARIDLLKMDVEGAEYDILFNCPDETLAKIQRVVMEYHEFAGEKRNRLDLARLLEKQGFHVLVEKGMFPQPHWFGTGISRIGIIKAWRQ